MGQMIELQAADGHHFAAYVAQPAGRAKGAVVVLQEIFGVNAHIQEVADGYAQAGYVAVAPATFDRCERGVNLGYKPEDMNAGFALKTAIEALPAPAVLADIQAAVDHAATVCAGKVGVVGYCWGGLLTWRAACLVKGLSAAVPYYGGGVTSAAEMARQLAWEQFREVLGELAPLTGEPRNATAVADTAMDLLVIGEREFSGLLEEVPGFAVRVLRNLAQRMIEREEADAD